VVECLNCGTSTANPKFCSSSCGAKYHNARRVLQEHHCESCKTLIGKGWQNRRKYCVDCLRTHKGWRDWSSTTLAELFASAPTHQAHARLRAKGRQTFLAAGKPRQCQLCGYSKHVEVCHIKPIASFKADTPVSVVNALSNLVGLCPNCHWEFDHGMLDLAA